MSIRSESICDFSDLEVDALANRGRHGPIYYEFMGLQTFRHAIRQSRTREDIASGLTPNQRVYEIQHIRVICSLRIFNRYRKGSVENNQKRQRKDERKHDGREDNVRPKGLEINLDDIVPLSWYPIHKRSPYLTTSHWLKCSCLIEC